jgi:hypothetical protein
VLRGIVDDEFFDFVAGQGYGHGGGALAGGCGLVCFGFAAPERPSVALSGNGGK